jgi:hypothetical protein
MPTRDREALEATNGVEALRVLEVYPLGFRSGADRRK